MERFNEVNVGQVKRSLREPSGEKFVSEAFTQAATTQWWEYLIFLEYELVSGIHGPTVKKELNLELPTLNKFANREVRNVKGSNKEQ